MNLAELLSTHTLLFIGLSGVAGLLIGSFLNVVIHRLPVMMEREWHTQCAELVARTSGTEEPCVLNLWTPRSHCPACLHPLRIRDNIPLLSYLLLRGRCFYCQTLISPQYPLVEALSCLPAMLVAWHFGFGWPALAALLLTWALIALSVIDFKHQLLPDRITIPFLWLGLGLALFDLFTDLRSSVIGAMAGYLSLWSVYQGFRLWTGKEGLGRGDFKLLAMLGAWQGWQQLIAIVILSSVLGALMGIGLVLLRGRDGNLPIPFGPFLAIAGWITLLWGESLGRFYADGIGL
jgi:leader peptidase (prepilin peptidase)/N-methyltransferase